MFGFLNQRYQCCTGNAQLVELLEFCSAYVSEKYFSQSEFLLFFPLTSFFDSIYNDSFPDYNGVHGVPGHMDEI